MILTALCILGSYVVFCITWAIISGLIIVKLNKINGDPDMVDLMILILPSLPLIYLFGAIVDVYRQIKYRIRGSSTKG